MIQINPVSWEIGNAMSDLYSAITDLHEADVIDAYKSITSAIARLERVKGMVEREALPVASNVSREG